MKVSRPDDDQIVLMTPQVAELARNNLALQLQAARLALLRNEQRIFEQSLDDADAWLGKYFDAGNGAVARARQTIAGIRGGYSAVESTARGKCCSSLLRNSP